MARGSAVIRWSPSGAMSRFVVTRPAGERPTYVAETLGHRICDMAEDGSLIVTGDTYFSWDDHEESVAFGETFVPIPGAFKLPDYVI